jgi:ABC-type branched-subunit amino acid transport system ATPase component
MSSDVAVSQSAVDAVRALFGDDDALPDGPMLSLAQVSVRFGGVQALREVSFEVRPHELSAVIGPNGAGKTSLLNAICGLTRSNCTGTITLAGRRISGRDAASIARGGVARSFQHPPLIEGATVMENIVSGLHGKLGYRVDHQLWAPRRVKRCEQEAQERGREALALVGLEDHATMLVAGLPYGARKLIDVVRALLPRPRLLMLDEPTSGLDAAEQAVVRDLLAALRASGCVTALVVEHHMDLVRAVAGQVIGLQAGEVLMVGTAEEVLDSDEFRAAVVGSTQDQTTGGSP